MNEPMTSAEIEEIRVWCEKAKDIPQAETTAHALNRLLAEVARLKAERDAAEKLIQASNAHDKMLREKYREMHPTFAAVLDENKALTDKLDATLKRAEAAEQLLAGAPSCQSCMWDGKDNKEWPCKDCCDGDRWSGKNLTKTGPDQAGKENK